MKGSFAPGSPSFDLVAISQPELVLQRRQHSQQFLLSLLRLRLMRKLGINRALKGRDSQRKEFRAAHEVTTGNLTCLLTELVGGHVTAEIAVEQIHQLQPLDTEPAASSRPERAI